MKNGRQYYPYCLILSWLLFSLAGVAQKPGFPEIRKADHFFNLLMFDSAEYHYKKAIALVNAEIEQELLCHISNKFAESLFWQDKLTEAGPVCFNNLKLCSDKLGRNHPETAQAHINLAAYKFCAGGAEAIEEHYLEAIFILEDIYGKVHPKVAKAYEWLGTFYENRADTIRSRKYLWKSYGIWKKCNGPDHPDLAEIYRYMGLYFKRFYMHDSAVFCFEKSKELFDRKYGKYNFQSVKCLNNLADIYAVHQETEALVLPTYRQCEQLMAGFASPNRMAEVMTLFNLAEYFRSKGDCYQAIEYMNKVLKCYYPDFIHKDIFDAPVHVERIPFSITKMAFLFKSSCFAVLADSDSLNKTDCLIAEYNCLLRADTVVDAIRLRIVHLDDMLHFSHHQATMYEKMVWNGVILYQITGNTTYADNALIHLSKKHIIEQSNKLDAFVWNNYNVPGEVLQKRNNIQAELNTLKAQRLNLAEHGAIDRLIIQKVIELDTYYSEYFGSVSPIDFFRSMTRNISLAHLRENLADDECLLLFSEYKDDRWRYPGRLISIFVDHDTILARKIENDTVFIKTEEFCQSVTSKNPSSATFASGAALYNRLIEPFEDYLNYSILILSSGMMSGVPFEALPDLKFSNDNLAPLMIENHLIRRLFSLDDVIQRKEDGIEQLHDSLLAVAPVFNSAGAAGISMLAQRDSSLVNLAGTMEECLKISDYIDTYLLTGKEASKQRFLSICKRYRYIHISTHGVPQQGIRQAVKLAFSITANDSAYNERWLNIFEILNLRLSADLVVLSACRTGFGQYNNGEGNLNLAWAFNTAGAKSAVIGLWDVNDYASMQIMPEFYRLISRGYPGPEALRLAKLEYIKNNDKTASTPYFWAGFDFIGMVTPDNNAGWFSNSNNLFSLLTVLILAGASVTIIYFRRRSKKNC